MAKLTKESFLESLKEMNIKEVMELVDALKEEYGIDPTAVAVAAGPAVGVAEEQTEFDVKLTSFGGNKVAVIKVVKEITGVGLMDAKKMTEGLQVIKESVSKNEADEIKTKLTEAGAEVELV
ncbi:MAG: 50S ribosomal protein L7/L12 [Mollicutes bacterium PWAP]|nr:50S ribosomal protein L7/L12 [Mollicutes bacterium PWAP]